jgi:hypothetical protein
LAKKTTDEKIQDFLSSCKKKLKKDILADDHNRREALECLKMLNGENHWDAKEVSRRKLEGRPCLKVPLFPSFVNQVVGEMLHNRARAKIKPGDHRSSPHIAKIRSGIIANAEYRSNGEDIYMTAGKSQVACGYGAWRINTRYCEENPFIQEFYMEAVPNPFTVYLDSTRKDEAGADAKHGWIMNRMSKDEFEEEWPHATPPSDTIKTGAGLKDELFFDKDHVTVCEYFCIKPKKVMMCLMEDGSVLTEEEAEERIKDHNELVSELLSSGPPAAPPGGPPVPAPMPVPQQAGPVPPGSATPSAAPPVGAGPMTGPVTAAGMAVPTASPMPPGQTLPPAPKIVKRRETQIKQVKHWSMTATEILGPSKSKEVSEEEYKNTLLEGEDFPGEYIPLVLVLGITLNVEGKTYVKGLIRDAKDAQKLVNYYESALAEVIALAPKAPWVMTPKQVDGFEEDYKHANVKNNPFLLYNQDIENGVAAPPPVRQSPGAPPVALFQQAARATDNLKRIIGMFGNDVGEPGPERTGAAVWAKQKPGDISTYVYAYKLNRGIEYSAKVMNSMIGQIIDTERDVRLRDIDDTEKVVPVNTTVERALEKMQRAPHVYKGMNPLKLTQEYQRGNDKAKFNDLTVGKYEVIVTVGPSYATARQESSAQLLSLINAVPKIGQIGGDIIVEGIDGVQSERLAARLRKTLPPGLAEPREGEVPFKPQMPPQVGLMIQKSKTEELKQQRELLKTRVELVKLYKETQESETDIRREVLNILSELHSPEVNPAVPGGQDIG